MKMGGNLCCLKQSKPDGRPKDADGGGLKDNRPLYSPVPHQRGKNMSAKTAKIRRIPTLEEWILNSPAMKPGCPNSPAMKPGCPSVGDIPVFKQAGKVRPMISSPSSLMNVQAQLSQPRDLNVHGHLSLATSPSTMRIKARLFSKSNEMIYMERKTRVAHKSPLSRESRQMQKEEDVGESIEGRLVSCHRKSKSEIVEVGEGSEGGLVPCLRKSKSVNSGKRVSFRLPEEADIYIFYEVEDEESCYY